MLCVVVGCGNNSGGPRVDSKFTEEAVPLEGSGFSGKFHQYLWTQANYSESSQKTETSYDGKESDAFFAVVRLDGETAQAQGLAGSTEIMETFLQIYVANYGGSNEELTAQDTDTEYVRILSFEYGDAEASTYRAKMVVDKASGELLLLLASYPNSSEQHIKDEITVIFETMTMQALGATSES